MKPLFSSGRRYFPGCLIEKVGFFRYLKANCINSLGAVCLAVPTYSVCSMQILGKKLPLILLQKVTALLVTAALLNAHGAPQKAHQRRWLVLSLASFLPPLDLQHCDVSDALKLASSSTRLCLLHQGKQHEGSIKNWAESQLFGRD